MHHLISRLFIVLLAVEGESGVEELSNEWVEKKFGDVVLKIWNIFLAPTGVI